MNTTMQTQRGGVTAEYVAVTGTMVALLLLPLAEGSSLIDILLDAFRHFQANTLFLLSMP